MFPAAHASKILALPDIRTFCFSLKQDDTFFLKLFFYSTPSSCHFRASTFASLFDNLDCSHHPTPSPNTALMFPSTHARAPLPPSWTCTMPPMPPTIAPRLHPPANVPRQNRSMPLPGAAPPASFTPGPNVVRWSLDTRAITTRVFPPRMMHGHSSPSIYPPSRPQKMPTIPQDTTAPQSQLHKRTPRQLSPRSPDYLMCLHPPLCPQARERLPACPPPSTTAPPLLLMISCVYTQSRLSGASANCYHNRHYSVTSGSSSLLGWRIQPRPHPTYSTYLSNSPLQVPGTGMSIHVSLPAILRDHINLNHLGSEASLPPPPGRPRVSARAWPALKPSSSIQAH